MEAHGNWSVSSMRVDVYEGKRNTPRQTLCPELSDVTEAVDSLNGADTSSLCIIGINGAALCVGGGPRLYHLSVTLPEKVVALCDPSKTDEQVDTIIGSIRTPLPANFIVTREMVQAAVDAYIADGVLASSLN